MNFAEYCLDFAKPDYSCFENIPKSGTLEKHEQIHKIEREKMMQNVIKFKDLQVGMRVKLKNYKDCGLPSRCQFQSFHSEPKRLQSEKVVTIDYLDRADFSFKTKETHEWFCLEWIDKICEPVKDAKNENNGKVEKVETMQKFKVGDEVVFPSEEELQNLPGKFKGWKTDGDILRVLKSKTGKIFKIRSIEMFEEDQMLVFENIAFRWPSMLFKNPEPNSKTEKAETMTKFKIGDSVKIVKKIEELVGWAEKMDDYLQKVGKITRIHEEGYISVEFEDSEWWNYNPESLELVNFDKVLKCEELKIGDIVRFPSEEEYHIFFHDKKIFGWTSSDLLEELEKFYGTNVEISKRSGSSDNAKCWSVKEIPGRRFPEFIFQKVDKVQISEHENNEQVKTSDINSDIETLKKKLLSLESKLFKECQYLKKPLRINEYEFLEREVLMLNEIPIIRVCQQPGGIQENFKEVEKFCNDYKDLTQTVKNLVKREKEKILKCIQKCEELEKL